MKMESYLETKKEYCVLLADLIIDQFIENRKRLESSAKKQSKKEYNKSTKDE